MDKKYEISKARKLGSVCVLTYMLTYYMRNILSVVTPQLLEQNLYSKEFIASLSSTYFLVYALGQLVNGVIGDIIKPRIMIMLGLFIAAVSLAVFPFVSGLTLSMLCFALLGFGFSMLRGPLVKTVSENTHPKYARLCCVFFSVACYFGPLIASLLALILDWNSLFIVSGIIAAASGIGSFVAFAYFEKKGLIVPVKKESEKFSFSDIFSVFKLNGFVLYLCMAMIMEIIGTSVAFWLPTYICEYLHFSSGTSGIIFSVITLLRSVAPFMSIILFHTFKNNDIKLMRVLFALSCVCFIAMRFVGNVWCNLVILLIAMMSNSCSSGVIWSVYIPSLGRTGKVSTANGLMDCSGYGAAAVFNVIFAKVVTLAGWSGLIIVWALIVAVGIVMTFFSKKVQPIEE